MAESPTAEQIAANTSKQAIIDLADRIAPADDMGHETDLENTAASVFVLLCRTAEVVAEMYALGRDEEAYNDDDLWTMLQGLSENMSTKTREFSCAWVTPPMTPQEWLVAATRAVQNGEIPPPFESRSI